MLLSSSAWGEPAPALTVTDPGGPGTPRRGTVTGSYRYGDNGTGAGFPITVTVTVNDAGVGTASMALTVSNVAPATAIDDGSAVQVNGVPTLVARAGQSVALDASATDPGSDDLALAWSFGNGMTSSSTSLVNPPTLDALPSPTVQPRTVGDSVSHVFARACLYQVGLTVHDDDDGGSVADSVPVVITGNATLVRSSGYWSAEYRAKRSSDFTTTLTVSWTGRSSRCWPTPRPCGWTRTAPAARCSRARACWSG